MDSLKSNKVHLARQVHNLKFEFDVAFEKLLNKLNSLTGEILVKARGDILKRAEREKLNGYWMELQVEVSAKMAKLTEFQNELNDRCHSIIMKTNYMDMSGPSTSQGPSGTIPPLRSHHYAPNPAFIPP